MMLGHLALPRDLPPGVTADEAIEWTRTHLDGQRLLLATIAFLAWDWLITLDDEKEFIWQENPLTVTKGLFVVNRYFPILHSAARFWSYSHERDPNLSVLACGHILDLAAYGSVVSIAVVEIVLLLRLWALYARNKKFGIFLIVVFLVGTGTALAIREVQPPDDFKLVHEPPISLTICKRSSPSELFFLYAIVLLVETMTFSLLLWKVWQLSAVGVAPILRTMLKHGTQYYLIVFLALFIQVLGTIVQPLFQPLADALPVVAIASVACSRLVLSLRGLYTAPRQNTTTQDFHARSGTTMGPLSRPVPLSVLRSQRESKSYLQTLDMTPDEERGLPYNTDTIPSPIMEEDGEHTDVDPSTRRTRSFETGHHSKGSWHAI